jgi:hypothetical protein
MGLTVAKDELHCVHVGQTGYREQSGNFAFDTTDLTGELPAGVESISDINVGPVNAPGTCTREINVHIGAVTATTSFPIILPPYAGILVSAKITVTTTHAVHEDDHWSFTLVNKGAAGAGTTDMILATAANSTDTTGGAAITAFVPRTLTRHGTLANYTFAAGDVAALVCTKAASAVSLAGLQLQLNLNVGDLGEYVYVDETVSGGVITRPSTGKLTVTRGGPTVTSALKVGYRMRGI